MEHFIQCNSEIIAKLYLVKANRNYFKGNILLSKFNLPILLHLVVGSKISFVSFSRKENTILNVTIKS